MNGRELVEPDVVDEAETLAKFADESLDFVIANDVSSTQRIRSPP